MIASSRKMVEELGIAHRLFEADVFAGRVDVVDHACSRLTISPPRWRASRLCAAKADQAKSHPR